MHQRRQRRMPHNGACHRPCDLAQKDADDARLEEGMLPFVTTNPPLPGTLSAHLSLSSCPITRPQMSRAGSSGLEAKTSELLAPHVVCRSPPPSSRGNSCHFPKYFPNGLLHQPGAYLKALLSCAFLAPAIKSTPVGRLSSLGRKPAVG